MKKRTIFCLLIAAFFIIPLAGNTVSAEELTYYFDDYNPLVCWPTNPGYMVDGNLSTFASTSTESVQHLTGSTYDPSHTDGTITKVEIRAYCKYSGSQVPKIILQPVFRSGNGDEHDITPGLLPSWSAWFDITEDTNAPDPWTWQDVDSLDCLVKVDADPEGPAFIAYCAKVEIRVTYTT